MPSRKFVFLFLVLTCTNVAPVKIIVSGICANLEQTHEAKVERIQADGRVKERFFRQAKAGRGCLSAGFRRAAKHFVGAGKLKTFSTRSFEM